MTRSRILLFHTFQLLPAPAPGAASPDPAPLPIRSTVLPRLLAFLVLRRDKPVERERLARLFWPQARSAVARRNLREYLYRARQLLDQFLPGQELLHADDQGVQLRLPASCWIDVEAFEQALDQAGQPGDPGTRIRLLEEACALYRGPLLQEIYDDWAATERARLHGRFLDGLTRLAELREATGDLAGAVEALERYLVQEPLAEPVHRRLMELHVRRGDRAQALEQFHRYAQTLETELGLPPEPEIQALYRAIQEGRHPVTGEPSQAPELDLAPPPRPPRGFVTPFAGRRRELARLDMAFQGRPQAPVDTVIVTGESGVGKTRLISEWLATLPDQVLVLRARAHEFEQGIPYRPLLDALQEALPRIDWAALPPAVTHTWLAPLAQLLPDLYFHLPDLPGLANPLESGASHYVMEGMAQLLLNMARQHPLLLFIDDLHWADRSTWAFLPFFSRRIRERPIFLVGAFSSSEATDEARRRLRRLERSPNVQTIQLSLLWPPDIADLLPRELKKAITSLGDFSRRLHQLTNGNPFFATEIVRALLESDLPRPYTAQSLTQLRLPDAVHTLIQTRLDRLEPESRQALCMAAAVQRGFDLPLLAAISGLAQETLLAYADDWLRRGLLVAKPNGGYDFSHQQIREVAYRLLSKPRRRYVHRRVAQALEGRRPVDLERVTRHYSLSDQPTRAIPGLLETGQRALNARSYQEAKAIGGTLLTLLAQAPVGDRSQDRLERRLQLALAHSFRGETEQALALFEEAAALAEEAGQPGKAAETLLRIAQIHWVRGDAPAARPHAERSLALLRGRDVDEPAITAAVLRLLGRLNIAQGRFPQAIPCLEESLSLLGQSAAEEMNRVTSMGYLMTAYARVGDVAGVERVMADVERRTRQLDSPALHAVIQAQRAVAFNALGWWEQALAAAQAGVAACQAQELPVYAFVARTVLGRAAHYLGDDETAYRVLRQAIAWAQDHDYLLFRYMAHLHLAEIASNRGDLETLEEQVAMVHQLAERTDNQWARQMVDQYWERGVGGRG